MNIDVYHGEYRDVDWIVRQVELFSKFYGGKVEMFPGQQYATDYITRLVEKQVVMVTKGIKKGLEDRAKWLENYGGAIDDGGVDPWVRTGFIAGYLTRHHFNPKIMILAEDFWWVNEKFRGGRSGLLLIEAFIEFGNDHADQVTMTLEEDSPVSDRVLTKRGFRVKEHSYLMEV